MKVLVVLSEYGYCREDRIDTIPVLEKKGVNMECVALKEKFATMDDPNRLLSVCKISRLKKMQLAVISIIRFECLQKYTLYYPPPNINTSVLVMPFNSGSLSLMI